LLAQGQLAVAFIGRVWVEALRVHLCNACPRLLLLHLLYDLHVFLHSVANFDAFLELVLRLPLLENDWVLVVDFGW